MKIKTKSAIIFLLLSLLPIVVIGLVAYKNGEDAIKKSLGFNFQQRAHETIEKVDRSMDDVYQNVKTWSRLEFMQELILGDMTSKISSFLIDLSREYKYFSSINVLNNQGKVVASSNPELIGSDLASETFYKEAIAGRAYTQDVHLDKDTMSWVVTFAFPIKVKSEEQQIIGVLCANWKAVELYTITQMYTRGVKGENRADVMLTRADGLVISAPEAEKKELFNRNLIKAGFTSAVYVSQRQEGYLVEKDTRGKRALIGYDYSRGYRDFSGFRWGALVIQDTSIIFAPVEQLKGFVFGIGIVVALIVVIIALMVARRMISPIVEMSKAATNVAQGIFEDRVTHSSGDEIGYLASVFNKMIGDLKEQRSKLVDKEELERNYEILRIANLLLRISLEDISLGEILKRALELLFSVPWLGGQIRGCIFLVEGDTGALKMKVQIGLPPAALKTCAMVPFGKCLCGRAAKEKIMQFVSSLDAGHQIRYEGIVPHGHYCVPITSSSGVLGVMNLYLQEGHQYNRRDENFLTAVANALAGVIERKQAEELLEKAYVELKKTQEELIQSEKLAALGRFSAGVAHEVKNPLAIIESGIEFLDLKLQGADQDTKTALSKIKEAVVRADNTVRDLLRFAKPSELKIERVNPNDLIREVVSLLAYKTPLANIEIKTEFAEEELHIEVDKNQIQQVIFNILLNAIDALLVQGKITIRTYRQTLAGKHNCILEFIDTGIGIPKENVVRLFEPFFTTKREKKGTGLGLSISKTIVNNHRGDIVIESELGKGTDVKVIFPLA